MKQYNVTGTDSEGDIQALHSDEPQRAEAVFRQFQEDLEDINLSEPLERYVARRES